MGSELASRQNAAEAPEAATPNQSQQDSLRLIVRCVTCDNQVRLMSLGDLAQEAVAFLTCGRFEVLPTIFRL